MQCNTGSKRFFRIQLNKISEFTSANCNDFPARNKWHSVAPTFGKRSNHFQK